MSALLAQGGSWDIRGVIHGLGPWIFGFAIVSVSSCVLVYFKLRRPRGESGVDRKSAGEELIVLEVGTNEHFAAYSFKEGFGVPLAEMG